MKSGRWASNEWGLLMPKAAKWNEAPCPRCKEPVAVIASRCPHCTTEFSAAEVAARKKANNGALIGGLAVLVLLGFGVQKCATGDTSAEIAAPAGSSPVMGSTESLMVSSPAKPEATQAGPALTGPQVNAARTASEYLNMSGFSRAGLIQQLSSSSGEGYDLADATAAVDSLDVDWNEQAARSAREYLNMSGFSCKGLIQQLSSSAGEKFTKDQAAYGAKKAGAC